jgi:hypothetical protein
MIKTGPSIHFFSDKKSLSSINAKRKGFDQKRLLLGSNFESKTFRAWLHDSESNKGELENKIESLMILAYNHKKMSQSDDLEGENYYEESVLGHDMDQQIELMQIDYDQMKTLDDLISLKNYDLKRFKDVELKYSSSTYKFKDERLATYYEADDLMYSD